MTKAYIAHHGILGQKWGRKNGPPYPLDATDHSAAEKKAGTKGWTKEAKSENKQSDSEKKDPTVKVLKAAREGANSAENLSNKIQRYKREDAPKKDLSEMSDAELRTAINRLDMERRYNDLTAPDVSKGEKYCSRALSVAGDVLAIGVSAAVIYATLKSKGL